MTMTNALYDNVGVNNRHTLVLSVPARLARPRCRGSKKRTAAWRGETILDVARTASRSFSDIDRVLQHQGGNVAIVRNGLRIVHPDASESERSLDFEASEGVATPEGFVVAGPKPEGERTRLIVAGFDPEGNELWRVPSARPSGSRVPGDASYACRMRPGQVRPRPSLLPIIWM